MLRPPLRVSQVRSNEIRDFRDRKDLLWEADFAPDALMQKMSGLVRKLIHETSLAIISNAPCEIRRYRCRGKFVHADGQRSAPEKMRPPMSPVLIKLIGMMRMRTRPIKGLHPSHRALSHSALHNLRKIVAELAHPSRPRCRQGGDASQEAQVPSTVFSTFFSSSAGG